MQTNETNSMGADTRECIGCDKELALADFSKDKNAPDGLSTACRGCNSARWNRWNEARQQDRDAVLPPLAKQWISRPLIQRAQA